MSKTILDTEAVQGKLMSGINKAADVVKSTAGPYGRLVLLGSTNVPTMTKDGINALRAIELEDPWEDKAVKLLCDAAERTVSKVGDGTTATTIFTQALLSATLGNLEKQQPPRGLIEALETDVTKVLDYIRRNSKKVVSEQDLYNIAFISTNGDAEMAKLCARASWAAGSYGIVEVVEGTSMADELTMTEGYRVESGFYHEQMSDSNGTFTAKHPLVLVIGGDLKGNDADVLMRAIAAQGIQNNLIVYATGFDDRALNVALQVGHSTHTRVVLSKLPSAGATQRAYGTDIASVAGTQVLPPAYISDPENVKKLQTELKDYIGRLDHVVMERHQTAITMPQNDKAKAYVASVKAELDGDNPMRTEFETARLRERYARLSGTICRIHVAAETATEMDERKDRYDDATLACQAAQRGGYSIGGGYNYLSAALSLFDTPPKWLTAPMEVLLTNANRNEPLADIAEKFKKGKVVQLKDGKYVPIKEYMVVDATDSQLSAITAAFSIAKLIINTSHGVTNVGPLKVRSL